MNEGDVRIVSGNRVIQQHARRQGLKARIGIAAPTGHGKSFTALSIATELQGDLPVLGIDTERSSLMLYAHDPSCTPSCTDPSHFEFSHLDWEPPYHPTELARFIDDESAKYGVIIVDSLSHFWRGTGGTLDQVDAIAARQGSGKNTFAAWQQGTEMQNQLVESMLGAKCHVILCMRSKMAYEIQKDEKTGRQSPVKIGLEPIQREDLAYELTVMCDLDREHRLIVTKSRCAAVADQIYTAHNERKMARVLREWLDSAAPYSHPRLPVDETQARDRVISQLADMDAESRRHLIIGQGYDAASRTPISDWVRSTDREHLVQLVERLHLPLDVQPVNGEDSFLAKPKAL